MELTDLQVFLLVIDRGGISAAAAAIHRVPSGVTTRIKLLEGELGTQLFERQGRQLRLTSDGQYLAGYARRILSLSADVRAGLGNAVDTGMLRVGMMDSAAYRFSPALATYHRSYPGVSLVLESGTATELLARVRQGTLDAAVVLDPDDDKDLQQQVLGRDEVCVISDRSIATIKSPSALGETTVLGFRTGCPYRVKLETWFAHSRLRPYRFVEIHSYHAIVGCVVAGMGVALVPTSITKGYAASAGFRTHKLPPQFAHGTLAVVYRAPAPSAKVQAFAASLQDQKHRT